ncbi:fibronectin type III domain-containing protein [Actinoplanes friuliensis]|uniref:Fibronectin type III domain-containing protein n=1 Tax=Actinoplanes friuliensis DSM 7358 TaxID=1246995 RepID=U5W1G4_9ACTN|nr:fibronectin type III domain-containing protein [Actinoplanes friuliensis]AGZ42862.1 fibronectin type III domain-containing protein [Actinoplanes friuliensis DSM 7358]
MATALPRRVQEWAMAVRRVSGPRRSVAMAAVVALAVLSSVIGLASPAAAAGGFVLSIYGGTGAAAAPVAGPVSASPIGRPDAMTSDAAGNVYVYVRSACRVVKISPAGVLSPVAGSGTCGTGSAGDALQSALSTNVTSLAVDGSGNLFVGDSGSARIYKVTPGGTLSVFAGNGTVGATTNGSATLSSVVPDSLAVDSTGTVFVGYVGRASVLKITAAGALTRYAGTGNAGLTLPGISTLANLNKPSSLAVDTSGNLYIGDTGNNRIYLVTTGQILSAFAGNGTTGSPVPGSTSSPVPTPAAMTFDSASTLYVAESSSRQILSFTLSGNGAPSLVAGSGGTGTPNPGTATSSPLGTVTALTATAPSSLVVGDSTYNYLLRIAAPTAPDAPTGLSAVPGPSRAVLTFSPPAGNGGSAITGYEVSTNNGTSWAALTVTGSTTRTGTVTGLTNGTAYTVRVRALNAIGNGAASAATTVTPATAPDAPYGLVVLAGDAAAALSFSPPLSNGGSAITGYEVSTDTGSSWTPIATTAGLLGVRNGSVTGLTNGISYTFQVRAANVVGAGPATAGVSATPRGAPYAPTALTATTGNAQATLTFTTPPDGGNTILGYQVSTDDGATWSGLVVSTSGTTNTATLTNLSNGTVYPVRVRALNLAGAGVPSAATTVSLAALVPDAPTGLVATAGDTTIGLSFAPPASTGGSALTGYEASTDNGTTWVPITTAAGLLGVRTATLTGLTNGTAYAVRVRAVNAVGPSPAGGSAAATPRGAPYAPTGLTAVAGDRQIGVTFTTPGDGGSAILGYQVSTDNGATWSGLAVTTSGTTNTATVTGLTNGVAYTVKVRAASLLGTGAASPGVPVVLQALVPGAPTGLVALAGDTTIALSFAPPATDGGSAITGYEASTDNGTTWAPITTAAGLLGTRTATLTGLTNGTTYAVRVRAVNAVGPGPAGTSVNATPKGAPYAPTGLSAVAGNTQATVTFTTPRDGGNPILGYQVSTDDGTTWSNLAVTTSGTTNTGAVGGLTNGTTYAIRVRAVSLGGTGAASAGTAVVLPALVPAAPTALFATAGDTTISVSFAPPATNGGAVITGYEASTDNGTTWAPITTAAGLLGNRTATLTGLTNGVTYTVRVRATNAAGASATSDSTTATPRGTPYAPAGLSAVPGNGQAVLTFTTPGDGGYPILGYQVSTDDGATWTTLTVATSGTDNTGTVTGLANGTTYAIRVRARNLAGAGTPSAATAVIPATVPGAPTAVAAAAGNTQITVTFTPPAATGGRPITGYEVSTDNGTTWAALPDSGLVTGLTNGVAYAVRVRAVNAVGAGTASASTTVTPIPATPDPPTGLAAERGDRSALLTFTPPVMTGTSPISGYEVSTDDGTSWAALASDRRVTGLTNGTAYTIRVRAVNASGAGPAGAAVTVTPATLPGAPTGLTVTIGDTRAVLAFTAPGDTGGDPITGYEVSTDDGTTWAPLAANRTVTGLTNGASYTFRVRAVNSVGPGPATAGSTATPATTPGAPTGVTATPGDNRAVVTFTPPASDGGSPITGYEVSTDDGVSWDTLAADGTVTGLSNNTTYTIRVRALNAAGPGPAGAATSVTPVDGLPGAPTALVAARGDRSTTLTFTAPADPGSSAISGYEVSTDNGASWAALAPDRRVTGLANGTTYTVQVRAVNDAGAGPASGGATVTPAAAPGAPAEVRASRGNRSATLTFTAPVNDGGDPITGYQVSTDNGATWVTLAGDRTVTGLTNGTTYAIRVRAVNGVGPGTPSAPVTVTPATSSGAPTALVAVRGNGSAALSFTAPDDTGGDPVTGYQVSTDNGVTWASLAGDRVVTGLTNGVTYTIRVRAVNSSGPGAASAPALVTPATAPGMPTGLSATAGDGTATLMFRAPDDGGDQITGYEVSVDDGTTWAALAGDHIVTGLTNATTYTVRIRALNSAGTGPPSASATVTPIAGVPGAPTGLTAVRGDSSVTLTWTAPADPGSSAITGYDVSTDAGVTWTALAGDGIVTGLTNGTAYDFWVRARNAVGPGPASDSVTATPATTPQAPTALTANPGDTTVTLAFRAPVDDGGAVIIGYDVSTDDGGTWAALPGDRTITGLTNGNAYTIRVRAVNDVGAGPAGDPVTATPSQGRPGVVTGLSATAGNTTATLSFTAPADPGSSAITGYDVTIDGGVTWTPLAGNRVVTGLTNGTAYFIAVRARNSTGAGPAGAEVMVIPVTTSAAPTGLTADAGDSVATLTFTAPADTGGDPVTGYEVSTDNGTTWSPLTVSGTTTLTGTVTGLTNGTPYPVRVRALTAAGPGAPSDSVTVTPATAADAPASFAVTAGDSSLQLMFSPPASDGGNPVTGYEVSVDDGTTWAAVAGDRIVTGLTNGVTYQVRVRAVTAAGPGAATDAVTITPVGGLPGAPTGLSVTRGDRSATATFTPPADPGSSAITGYEVSTDDGWNWAPLAPSGVIPALTNGTTYVVRVRAVNTTGAGPAGDGVPVTPAAVPGPPTGLRVTAGDTTATVAFTAPADDGGAAITGYEVSTDNGVTWAALANDRRIPGLTNGTTYSVRVRAVNDVGAGPAGAAVTVTPRALPGAPTDVTATPGNASATIAFTPPADGGATITGYEVSTDNGATWRSLAANGTVPDLTNGTTYTVRIRARNSAGAGPASAAVTVTPAAVPGAPTDLTAVPGDGTATLSFTAPAAGGSAITGYDVSTDDGVTWAPLAGGVVTGLTNGDTYTVRVRARNSVGAGPASNPVTVTPATVPDAPAGLTATPGNASISVTFSPPADGGSPITGYEASSNNGTTWSPLTVSGATTRTGTLTGLDNGTTYAVRVRARNSAGAGPASANATATPTAGLPGTPGGVSVARGNASATVTFTPGGGTVTGYQVSTDDGETWRTLPADGTITGLTNGVTYAVRIRAVNNSGTSAASPSVTVTPATTPGAPTQVTAVRGDRSATLTFTPPAGDGGAPITGYETSVDGGDTWTVLGDDGVVGGLSNGTAYTIRVRARNDVGAGPAAVAPPVTPAAGPGAPTGVSAVPGDGRVTVTFTPPASDGGSTITGYEVSVDNGTTWAALAGTGIVTGLTNGTAYTIRVRALSGAGTGPASAAVTVTPATVPASPTGLSAAPGDASATVTFSPPNAGGSPITRYEISTDDGASWATLAVAGTGATRTGMVDGLTNGAEVQVRVRARNDVGPGAPSAAVAVTPVTGLPSAPGDVTVTPGNASVSIAFTPPTGGVTSYEVSIDDGVTWTTLAGNGIVAGLTNGTAYTVRIRARNATGAGPASPGYVTTPATTPAAPTALSATRGPGSATLTFTPGATGGTPVTSYETSIDGGATWQTLQAGGIVTGLTNGTAYTIAVRARNAVGAGAIATVTVTPATTPGAPTAVTAARGDASASVAFTAPASTGGAAILRYEVSVDNGTTWATLAGNRIVTGLTNGTAYAIRLRAVNEVGAGAPSATASVTPATTPGAPTAVAVSPGDASASVNFTAPASTGGAAITGYQVSTDNGTTWAALAGNRIVTGLTNGTAYLIRVRAVNEVGTGAPSAATTVTPAVALPGAPTGLTVTRGDGSATVAFTAGGGDPVSYEVSADGGVTWTALAADRVVTGLTNGTTYAIAVRAVNPAGAGPATPAVTVTPATLPGAPTLGSVVFTTTSVTITFTAPATDGGSPVTAYELSLDGGATFNPVTPTGTGTLTVTVTGLTSGTVYAVALRARNAVGAGPADSEFAASTPPAAPTQLAVTRGDASATLTFTPPDDETITGYQVSTDNGATWTDLAVEGTSPLTATVTGLDNTSTYRFRVRAVNEAGPGRASDAVTSTVATAPGAPQAVTATGRTSSILVTWAPPDNSPVPVTGYRAVASPGPATCTTGPSETSCVLGGRAGVEYTVRVVALSTGGSTTSTASATATPVAPSLPTAPPSSAPSLTTADGDITTAVPGQEIVLVGDGFAPHSTVQIAVYSKPQLLDTVVTDADGSFRKLVRLPAGLAAGQHTLLATGVDPDGNVLVRTLSVTVKAATSAPTAPSVDPEPGTSMPKTGQNIALVAALGLLMICVGTGLVLVRRDRR